MSNEFLMAIIEETEIPSIGGNPQFSIHVQFIFGGMELCRGIGIEVNSTHAQPVLQ